MRQALSAAPGFLVSAHTAGSGKTLLAKALAQLAGAKTPYVMANSKEEEESKKRLLALGRSATPAAIIDNVNGTFGSDSLNAWLTAETYSDRILGQSETVTVGTKLLLLITGNNVTLKGDLCRRVLTCVIDPEMEQPYTRSFPFDPEVYCKQHRLELVRATLTILKASRNAGAKCPGGYASFELWSETVRAAVLWLSAEGFGEYPDPLDVISKSYDDDPETSRLRRLLEVWHRVYDSRSMALGEIIPMPFVEGERIPFEILDEIAGEHGKINIKRLGHWIKKFSERYVGGLKFRRSSDRGGSATWMVQRG